MKHFGRDLYNRWYTSSHPNARLSLCGRVLMHSFPPVCLRSAQLTVEPVHPIPALTIVGGLIHVYMVSSLLSSYTMLSELQHSHKSSLSS